MRITMHADKAHLLLAEHARCCGTPSSILATQPAWERPQMRLQGSLQHTAMLSGINDANIDTSTASPYVFCLLSAMQERCSPKESLPTLAQHNVTS